MTPTEPTAGDGPQPEPTPEEELASRENDEGVEPNPEAGDDHEEHRGGEG